MFASWCGVLTLAALFAVLLPACWAENSTTGDSNEGQGGLLTPLLGGALGLSILINGLLVALHFLRKHQRRHEGLPSSEATTAPAKVEQCRAEASQDETVDHHPAGSDEFISQSAEANAEFLQDGGNDDGPNYDVVEYPPHHATTPEPKRSSDAGYSIPRNTGKLLVPRGKKMHSESKLSARIKPPIQPRPRLSSSFSTPNLTSRPSQPKAVSLPRIIVAADEDLLKDVRRNALDSQGKSVKPRKYYTAPEAASRTLTSPSASSNKVGRSGPAAEKKPGNRKPAPATKVKFFNQFDYDDYVEMDSMDVSSPAFLRTDSLASYVSMHSTAIGHGEPSSMANHGQASFCLASGSQDDDAHHLGGSAQLSNSSSGDVNSLNANFTD